MLMIYVLTGFIINGGTALILRNFFPLQHVIDARELSIRSVEDIHNDEEVFEHSTNEGAVSDEKDTENAATKLQSA